MPRAAWLRKHVTAWHSLGSARLGYASYKQVRNVDATALLRARLSRASLSPRRCVLRCISAFARLAVCGAQLGWWRMERTLSNPLVPIFGIAVSIWAM